MAAKNAIATDSRPRYHMPAEWEPHEATWIAWPHNRADWPGKLAAIHWVYAEIARKLVPGEIVRILVNDKQHQRRATRYLTRADVDLSRVEFFRFPTDRGWTRDFGPIFARRAGRRAGHHGGHRAGYSGGCHGELSIVDFAFNAWAKYPQWRKDNRIASKAARALGLPLVRPDVDGRQLVLEGGAVDVNGRGTLLTTEECLFDAEIQARNPGMTRPDIEAALRDYLGATNVLWLGRGIAGDDTHGHIDDVCRFVNERTVVVCQEDDRGDENHRALCENRERLQGMRLEDGGRLEAVPLPMPAPLHFDGHRLPAGYANFYIANAAVLVPTFNDANDRIALGVLAELFAPKPVVGIHAVDLAWGFGTIHCLTQQQPTPGSTMSTSAR